MLICYLKYRKCNFEFLFHKSLIFHGYPDSNGLILYIFLCFVEAGRGKGPSKEEKRSSREGRKGKTRKGKKR